MCSLSPLVDGIPDQDAYNFGLIPFVPLRVLRASGNSELIHGIAASKSAI